MSQPTITPEIEKLRKSKNFASIATLTKEDSPQVSNILVNTAEGRLKTNNALRDSRVVKLEDEIALLRSELDIVKKALRNEIARYEISTIKKGQEISSIIN